MWQDHRVDNCDTGREVPAATSRPDPHVARLVDWIVRVPSGLVEELVDVLGLNVVFDGTVAGRAGILC